MWVRKEHTFGNGGVSAAGAHEIVSGAPGVAGVIVPRLAGKAE